MAEYSNQKKDPEPYEPSEISCEEKLNAKMIELDNLRALNKRLMDKITQQKNQINQQKDEMEGVTVQSKLDANGKKAAEKKATDAETKIRTLEKQVSLLKEKDRDRQDSDTKKANNSKNKARQDTNVYSNLEQQLATAEEKIKDYKEQNEILSKKIAALEAAEIGKIMARLDKQDVIIEELKSTITKQNSTITEIKSTITELQSTITKQNSAITELKSEISILKKDNETIKQDRAIAIWNLQQRQVFATIDRYFFSFCNLPETTSYNSLHEVAIAAEGGNKRTIDALDTAAKATGMSNEELKSLGNWIYQKTWGLSHEAHPKLDNKIWALVFKSVVNPPKDVAWDKVERKMDDIKRFQIDEDNKSKNN